MSVEGGFGGTEGFCPAGRAFFLIRQKETKIRFRGCTPKDPKGLWLGLLEGGIFGVQRYSPTGVGSLVVQLSCHLNGLKKGGHRVKGVRSGSRSRDGADRLS